MTSQGLVLLFEVGTWPPHDGFRRMGRFNLWSVLADDGFFCSKVRKTTWAGLAVQG